MDRVIRNKDIVHQLLHEIINYLPEESNLELLPIIDEERGQYLLYSDGWQEEIVLAFQAPYRRELSGFAIG